MDAQRPVERYTMAHGALLAIGGIDPYLAQRRQRIREDRDSRRLDSVVVRHED
jgi:hypothetical protein